MSKVTISTMKKGYVASSTEKVLIKKCVLYALEAERIENSCLVSVHTTDNSGIRKLNRENRSIDRATDVLSFPMLALKPGEKPEPAPGNIDPETGLIYLGDIVISIEMANSQAREYGHSIERELGFLTVHSLLHLLGYDHEYGGDEEAEMRDIEERILSGLGLVRNS